MSDSNCQSKTKDNNQPSKVRFEEIDPVPQEKPVKKAYLEKTLAKELTGAKEEPPRQMLAEGKMNLSYGEIFAISNGVVNAFKKKISNRRVPIEDKTVSHGTMMEDDNEDPLTTHYSCPLGYIKLNINGQKSQALLDTGSMVNLIPEHLAHQLGLVITEEPMNLKGIGGHQTGISGIAEGVDVLIGKLTRPVHFWVAKGPVQFILGKPFLIDVAANIKYHSEGGELLAILDPKGQTYLISILTPKHHKWETTPLPANMVTRDFLVVAQDFNYTK
ncbi:hypothetical protein PGT21_018178 [Puccinia graminis f. sp. tritici]|uniref:Peptidase A2 domain-containing protein n=1 Tax=Puccinia graminis f. sp. tritici TaxID=56615 RepID=A0A5B0QFH8_PUCGR|nr:hypothetical protein PGT21_018178 [Puccinia graminis f. sp. tritici]